MRFLIALTENDKRVLIALGLLLILVFVLVGYIGLLVERTMKRQAKKVGVMMHDVVAAKVITNSRAFIKFGRKKNNRLFFKQAYIPFLILLFALFIYILYGAITRNWGLKIFDYKKEGFCTLLFLWDFTDPKIYVPWFGIKIIGNWPPILNTPHFEGAAWASYLIVPSIFAGFGWLFVVVQAHISRAFRIKKLAKTIFSPTLDNIQAVSPLQNPTINNQVNNQTNDSVIKKK